jgi:hypothetical protein
MSSFTGIGVVQCGFIACSGAMNIEDTILIAVPNFKHLATFFRREAVVGKAIGPTYECLEASL